MNGTSSSDLLQKIHNMANTLHSMAGGNVEVLWNNNGWNIICTQGCAYLRHSQEGELQFESIDDVGQRQIAIDKMQKAIFITHVKAMLRKSNYDVNISKAKIITFQEKDANITTTIDLENQTLQRDGQQLYKLGWDDTHIQHIAAGITEVKIDSKTISQQTNTTMPEMQAQAQNTQAALQQAQNKITQKLQVIYKEELKDITQGQYKQEYEKELRDLLNAKTLEQLQAKSNDLEQKLNVAKQKTERRQELAKQINEKAKYLFEANGGKEVNLTLREYDLIANANGAYLKHKDGNIYSFPECTAGTSIDDTLNGYAEVHEIINTALNKKLDHIKSQQQFNALRDNVRDPGEYRPVREKAVSDKVTLLHQIPNDGQSAIRIENKDQTKTTWEHDEIINKMSGILAEAIKNTEGAIENSSLLRKPDFIKFVIQFAQANGGVGNVGVDEWVKYFGGGGAPEHFKIAKELSRQYQIVAERSGFFTGRTQNLKSPLVGQRLYRIPSGATEAIVNGAFALLTQAKQK